MQLTDYSIYDLEELLTAVKFRRRILKEVQNEGVYNFSRQINCMLLFEHDIEQAIKDVKFEQERKDNLPIEP